MTKESFARKLAKIAQTMEDNPEDFQIVQVHGVFELTYGNEGEAHHRLLSAFEGEIEEIPEE